MTDQERDAWTAEQAKATSAPHPCPACGHCPTCGRGGYIAYPPYYVPYPQPVPYIYWGTKTITGGTTNVTNTGALTYEVF